MLWPALPRLTPERVSTLLGAFGLLGLVVAVFGLTRSPWWALAVASVEALFVSWALSTQVRAQAAAAGPRRPAAASRPAA